MLTAGLLLLGVALFHRGDRLLPGTNIGGVSLGGRRMADAERELERQWADRPIQFDTTTGSWATRPRDVGMDLDVAASVEAAYRLGRTRAGLEALLRWRQIPVAPVWRLDETLARRFITAVALQADKPGTPPRVDLVNGRAVVVPGENGVRVDVPASVATLMVDVNAVARTGRMELVTQTVPAPERDLGAAAAALDQALGKTVGLTIYDPVKNEELVWEIPPEEWNSWLDSADLADDGTRASWSLDESRVAAWLSGAAERLAADQYVEAEEVTAALQAFVDNQPVKRPRIYYRERKHKVARGETLATIGAKYGIPYPLIARANGNLKDPLLTGAELIIPSADTLLPLPLEENKRIVVSLTNHRLTALEDGKTKWVWVVSTGTPATPTWPGVYQVVSRSALSQSRDWDMTLPRVLSVHGPDPALAHVNAIHGPPTRDSDVLWADAIGEPVTNGSIMLGAMESELLYEWADKGTVVEIKP
jgi:lipoprotein-anchoring transpeptidase ErfK/SrfK